MARLRPKHSGRNSVRKVDSYISIERLAYSSNPRTRAFKACVVVGSRSKVLGKRTNVVCARGKNPRSALAKALVQSAGRVRRRKGAFAGR